MLFIRAFRKPISSILGIIISFEFHYWFFILVSRRTYLLIFFFSPDRHCLVNQIFRSHYSAICLQPLRYRMSAVSYKTDTFTTIKGNRSSAIESQSIDIKSQHKHKNVYWQYTNNNSCPGSGWRDTPFVLLFADDGFEKLTEFVPH